MTLKLVTGDFFELDQLTLWLHRSSFMFGLKKTLGKVSKDVVEQI